MSDGVLIAGVEYVCSVCRDERTVYVSPILDEDEVPTIDLDGRHRAVSTDCSTCSAERPHVASRLVDEPERAVLAPHEDGTGECYHARGGCGGHLVTSVSEDAETLIVERGLRPCSAHGCEDAGIAIPERCDGCGRPTFEPYRRDGSAGGGFCSTCEVLLTFVDRGEFDHYRLPESVDVEDGDPDE